MGSVLADDTRQIVHKRPAVVYSNVSEALAISPQSGKMQFEGGQPVPYKIRVDRSPGERLVVHLALNGREAGQVELAFAPENGGEDTMIIAKVDSDGKVVREELAGTDKAKLGYAPDWLLTFAFGRSLKEAAEQIEEGSYIVDPAQSFASGGQAGISAEEQKQLDKWRQYQASRPTMDPNEAADRYMGR